ncbi:flavodoxin domain-containing protein [Oceanispirochaeta sp.]|jgi:flavodoxin I|uniref:flavodoxin domain-containing protein n=1 Tax=Oceanispirochaeta sp. TaxID=2035350 RepID=UPI00261A8A3A|nr:flavodoxin domain-containing protein [Oceanispirochaeta sp.]MDA3957711.1 flavodoxin domain-containing protein [Oceanispirochaeta sp.]
MEKAIIVYGSKQGKTAKMAAIIASVLEERDIPVTTRNVFETRPEDLNDYKFIILGSSTWSNGDLQSDFIDFEIGMDDLDLKGHFAAAFGSGSSRFPYFCEAVRILEAKLRSLGNRMILPSLMVNDLENRTEEESREWAAILADEIKQIN